ncbi:hypothetical protein SNE40_003460 [Patella caerulea]|uniref:Uncharacterized protein n=1 Tax=Patella caerulea TaxID=87958 RepID=A0AAN8KE06_PATCE
MTMEYLKPLFIFLVIGTVKTAAAAAGCVTTAQECANAADVEKSSGKDVCTVYRDMLKCISSINLKGCSLQDKSFIVQINQDAQQNVDKYCNGTVASTTPVVGCVTRAQVCANTADADKNSGKDVCSVYRDLLKCVSSINLKGCSLQDKSFIVQINQDAQQNVDKYCNGTIATTTPVVGCVTRAQVCATTADAEKNSGEDVCTVYRDLLKCVSSININDCSLQDKSFIAQIMQDAQQNADKYCNATLATTTPVVGCVTRAQVCANTAGAEMKSGKDVCTVYRDLLKCVTSINFNDCSLQDKSFIAQIIQDAQQHVDKNCNDARETTSTDTPVAQTCYAQSQVCGDKTMNIFNKTSSHCAASRFFKKCLLAIPAKECSQYDQEMWMEFLDSARKEVQQYCYGGGTTPTTTATKTDVCTLKVENCYMGEGRSEQTGMSRCSASNQFKNCVEKINNLMCSQSGKMDVSNYLDMAKRDILNYCPDSSSSVVSPNGFIICCMIILMKVFNYR